MKKILIAFLPFLFVSAGFAYAADTAGDKPLWSPQVQMVLNTTKPLTYDRGNRLPLYLWPAMDPGPLDDVSAEALVRELDRRRIGLVSSWSPKNREKTLSQGLTIARAQKKLGLLVNINATNCLSSFFNGDERTAHRDSKGNPFWDTSFGSQKIGCPFTLDFRRAPIREQVEYFARAYKEAGLDVGFVFADWEIDGPLEFNRAWEASKNCRICRDHIKKIDQFPAFQKAVRTLRSEMQRDVFADPIRSRFPRALVGNYAVNPHDGYRYWYDYFEYYVDGQPCRTDQQAKYRNWYPEFPLTGYTFAMPVVYTWYPIYSWYDFEDSDYRWFYALLLEASSVGKSTPANVPIISFVHWHTTSPPEKSDPLVKQFSAGRYQELLWHMLLRGTDTFFLWCPKDEAPEEVKLLHEVYAAAQQYGEFWEKGTPVSFEVPKKPGAVVSGLRLGNRVLVRRTDFTASEAPVVVKVGVKKLSIPAARGMCQILELK
ncbi:MAG: hypothetical protein Q8O92_01890 [Candidatus Latescibacter sp.]|nr:hypothetical protein [Candidatus Latescibacter sp.]